MYKVLLCWRYLLTRYLAFACIISVMLGVATLIVVNSVMGGFSAKLKERLHALLSDVLIESPSMDGFGNYRSMMERIRRDPYLSDKIEAMTPALEVFAMLQFDCRGSEWTMPVRLIGIDPVGRSNVGGFAEYLVRQNGSADPNFALTPEAYKRWRLHDRPVLFEGSIRPEPPDSNEPPPPEPPPSQEKIPEGIILGYAIASFRKTGPEPAQHEDVLLLEPGDEVRITTVRGQIEGKPPAPVSDRFAVTDYFRSEMSEYDRQYAFVSLPYLQKLRVMEDRVTSIQIKLRDYRDARPVVQRLNAMFGPLGLRVETWEDKQGPILAAISIERGLLNVLLFLIIGVAGFGILAIFSMIVAEKIRDIGILKALGASNAGVMKIFLGYGLLLGAIGAALGTILGLEFTWNINEIEQLLGRVTGMEIFPRRIYYFDQIPTSIQPTGIAFIVVGALIIAVLSSVIPALRAALLHPVRALRYE
jgi:lipoprotein-releasing system permease protein